MARPPKWSGQQLLEQQDPTEPLLKDLQQLYTSLLKFKAGRDKLRSELAVRLEKIVNTEGDLKPLRLQKIVRELVELLALLCLGSTKISRFWGKAKCPLLPLKKEVDGVHPHAKGKGYTNVKLGTVDGHVVQLRLHRIVAFLACGQPPPGKALATHGCGIKGCLRLACLSWGDHSSNAMDAYNYEHEHGRHLEGSQATPAM